MNTHEIVASTAEAAFATDQNGTIVAWNKAAEQLLGYEARQVLGKFCHLVVCGTDIFGNRFCDGNCPLSNMTRRHEAVSKFELDLRNATSEIFRTEIVVTVVSGRARSKFTIIHLLKALENGKETRSAAAGFLLPGRAAGQSSFHGSNSGPLTSREIEVLQQLAAGTSTKDIAKLLFISVATVRNHIQNILSKLSVHSRLEAVSLAQRLGLM